MASYLHGWDEKSLRPYSETDIFQDCFPIAHAWHFCAGPHIVSRVDGSDFTMEDIKLVWAFVKYVSDGFGESREEFSDGNHMYPELAVTPHTFETFKNTLFMSEAAHSIMSSPVHPAVCRPWIEVPDPLEEEATGANAETRPNESADEEARTIADAQSVLSVEQPTTISPEEAAVIAEELWASNVEHLARIGSHESPARQEERVVVLAFSRASTELDTALLQCPLAHDAIAQGVDIQPAWAHGAKIFVDGIGPEKLEAPGLSHLLPAHVVIKEKHECDLMNALRQLLPYRIMKRKPGGAGKYVVPDDLSLANVSSSMTGIITDADGSQASSMEPHITENIGPSTDVLEYTIRNTFLNVDDHNYSVDLSDRAKTA